MSRTVYVATLLAFLLGAVTVSAMEPVQQVRLYALECGTIESKDLSAFSDTYEYEGKAGNLVDGCFVIRHPKGTLLWDAGLGDAMAEKKDGVVDGAFHMWVKTTLASQLKLIGLAPADITYLAFSHFHFDHIGNATQFPGATWILSKAELDAANSQPAMFDLSTEFSSTLAVAKQKVITNDEDVFGDGSVQILKTPGHTPGHQSLAVKLQKTGTVLLSDDLYILRSSRQFRRIPTFNYSRADTLASIDRIETIVKNTKARIVVQHDAEDFKALPKFPAYLD